MQWRSAVQNGRTIDEIEVVGSVLLAIAFGHWLGASNISWAAFTGFVLMRGQMSEVLWRAMLRLVGTIVGAALALLVVPFVSHSVPGVAIVGGVFGAIAMYGALTTRRAYAWLLGGLTFEMVLFDAFQHPDFSIPRFAETRLLEVLAGTAACILVAWASQRTLRRRLPSEAPPRPQGVGWHSAAARHAAQAGIAIVLLVPIHQLFPLPEITQGCVTVMATMLIPVGGIGTSGLKPVTRRLVQRVVGCLAGSLLAFGCLMLARVGGTSHHANAAILLAGTALGVMIGRHIENGGTKRSYVGTQLVLAVLVTLVPDSYANAAITPAISRLLGILTGLLLLEPVLLGWHLLAPRTVSPAPASTSAPSDE